MKVLRITVKREEDPHSDISHLGTYSHEPREGCIDRAKHADEGAPVGAFGYRYFIPTNHVPYNAGDWEHVTGKALAAVIKEFGSTVKAAESYALQDYERAEAWNRGAWCMVGVVAVAEVEVNGARQTIKSPGLWGIESDSGEDHFKEVGEEQLSELRAILRELGFKRIPRAVGV